MLTDKMNYEGLEGYIRLYEAGNPNNILFEQKNTICNGVKWLFARLMAGSAEPLFGVWGLAVGQGDLNWPEETQVVATANDWRLRSELLRKRCTARFVDTNLNPVAAGVTTRWVDFQTPINATSDGLVVNGVVVPLREMGLIGGGSSSPQTVMTTAPYFDPSNPSSDSVILVNYKTHGPLKLPDGIDLILSWIIKF